MQLTDLSIRNRINAINIKADMTDDDRLSVLKTNDYLSTIKGIKALLLTEPYFFLVNEDFLDTALEMSIIYNDLYAINKLNNLKQQLIDNPKVSNRKVTSYINSEKFKRGFNFTYIDYLEMLELDDLLLRETDYNYVLENPYILYSIPYLKNIFSDYYINNKRADDYLYIILKLLLKDEDISFEDRNNINSTIKLFQKQVNSKIITFDRRIK